MKKVEQNQNRPCLGISLVEVLVGVSLILIVFVGIFGAYRLALKVVGQSKARVIATAIANEQLERVRNLSYLDVGTNESGCDPCGKVEKFFSTTSNNILFNVTTTIICYDDPKDGIGDSDSTYTSEGNKVCNCDYRKVKVRVGWSGLFGGEISQNGIVAPRSGDEECEYTGGVLKVTVFNAKGEKISSPLIRVTNINTGAVREATPDDGTYYFVLATGTAAYVVTTTKEGFGTEQTYGIGDVYETQTIANPEKPHATVLEGQLTEYSFCIDRLSKFSIHTLEAKAEHIYYVRKIGSDSNDGLSPDNAFLTIQKAANVAQAGDFVFVGAGEYQEKVEIENSGTSQKPIVFVADTEGAYTGDKGEVKVSGKDIGFYIEDKKYIGIYGFKISNTTGTAGIYITGASAGNIEIKDNDISDNAGDGIRVESASDVVISYNSISSNSGRGIYLEGANSSEVINNQIFQNLSEGIFNNGSGAVLIEFNRVFSNGGEGILVFNNANNNQIKDNRLFLNSGDGIRVSSNISSIEVSDNRCYSNQGNGIAFTDHISNASRIRSNLVYLNQKSGILLFDHCVNDTVSNNTSFHNGENGILIENSKNNEIKNNIIALSGLSGIKVSSSTNIDVGYNNLWKNSPNYDGISLGIGSISADPLFVDIDGQDNVLGGDYGGDDDFHLKQISAGQATTSLCVDAGSDSASNLGMDDKTTRTDNVLDSGIVDMGFHYSLETLPSSVTPDPFGAEIPDTTFHLLLEKRCSGIEAIVGKDASDNKIYKYSKDHQTDDNGFLELSDLENGTYSFSDFSAAGEDLDLIISYPSLMPISLAPGVTTTVKLGLRAEGTLLVRVLDASTSEPIFSAQVRVYDTDYDRIQLTDQKGEAYF
ncbi:right-handed parallel beta-helix repeat-containing protein, partial [bacterium]|nr:right-handed parallel beta-helix repeat-containing protein [bacterium]